MKLLLKSAKSALLAFILLGAVSCSDDDTTTTTNESLYEVAQQQSDLSLFVQAIDIAGVKASYESPSDFTVLAPTNAALSDFLAENNYNGIDAVPVETLKQILFNHLLNANFKKETFTSGYISTFAFVPTAANSNIRLLVDTSDGVKFNGIAKIIVPNLEARNGHVHIVDKVIAIPTIYDHIRVNPDLTTLKTALDRSSSAPIRQTLSAGLQAPYTFFAPSNAAFASLLDELDIESLDEVSDAVLLEVLEYHIIPSQNILNSTFSNGQVLTSLTGQPITVTLTGGGKKLTDVNGRVSTILYVDIQGSNGVIHAVDKVLQP